MNPRSVFTPTLSNPSFSSIGSRPVATRTWSKPAMVSPFSSVRVSVPSASFVTVWGENQHKKAKQQKPIKPCQSGNRSEQALAKAQANRTIKKVRLAKTQNKSTTLEEKLGYRLPSNKQSVHSSGRQIYHSTTAYFTGTDAYTIYGTCLQLHLIWLQKDMECTPYATLMDTLHSNYPTINMSLESSVCTSYSSQIFTTGTRYRCTAAGTTAIHTPAVWRISFTLVVVWGFSFSPDFSISDTRVSTIRESKERRGVPFRTKRVVSVPSEWNTPASSTAMYPAPMTATFFGWSWQHAQPDGSSVQYLSEFYWETVQHLNEKLP